MHASPSTAFRNSPDPGAEEWVSFSFPVTWTFLAVEPRIEQQAAPPRPRPVEVKSTAVAVVEPIKPPEFIPPAAAPTPSSDTWEMVIPRMDRPAPRVSAIPEKRPEAPAPPKPAPHPHIKVEEPASVPDKPDERLPAIYAELETASRLVPISAMVVAGAILMGAGLFYLGGNAVLGGSPAGTGEASVQVSPLLPVGPAGWTVVSTWPRRVSLLRGYGDLTDFRMEFEGTINSKALGWVFRASDPRNFYAMKLEIVTPGRDPVVVLKRFAVIDGRDQDVVQVPLRATARLDTLYKIRVDALGDRFTTWVQNLKVDQWTEPRFSKGAIGLYSDLGERGTVKGDVKVFHLERK